MKHKKGDTLTINDSSKHKGKSGEVVVVSEEGLTVRLENGDLWFMFYSEM